MKININIGVFKLASVLLIALPYFAFFLGWLRLELGITLTILLVYGLFQYIKSLNFNQKEPVLLLNLLFIAAILTLFVMLSGAGGFGNQVSDYTKQNIVTKDLMLQNWPVEYQNKGEKSFLTTYLGFYILAPALVGHFGWMAVNAFNFVYMLVSVLIAAFWMARFARSFKIEFPFFFVLIGGITAISFLILNGTDSLAVYIEKIKTNAHFFWLNAWDTIPVTYLSMVEQITWSPQHTLPCWVLMGLFINDWLLDDETTFTPFYLSLIALWSPLVLVGIAPFFLYLLVQKGFKLILNLTNFVVAPIIFLVVASMLLSLEVGSFPSHLIFKYENLIGNSLAQKIGVYLYFIFFEVIIWWLPTFYILRKKLYTKERNVLIFTGILLCIVPLYRYGLWNDFVGRCSMAGLFLLFAFVWRAYSAATFRWRLLFIALLGLSSMTPLAHLIGSFRSAGYSLKMNPPKYETISDLPAFAVSFSLDQFVAKPETFFYKYLAKQKASIQINNEQNHTIISK
jgi:hypothetical protein